MAFSAEFVLDGTSFPVLTCEYSMHQPTNSRGKNIASVRSGLIRVSLEVQENIDLLTAWAASTDEEKSGEIVFHNIDARSTFKRVTFSQAYCVSYREVFTPSSGVSSSYRIDLGITANVINIGAAQHHSLW